MAHGRQRWMENKAQTKINMIQADRHSKYSVELEVLQAAESTSLLKTDPAARSTYL